MTKPKADKKQVIAAAPAKFDSPSLQMIHELELAYNWFNGKLFEGKLKPCILLMHRKKGARGYFWANRWKVGDKDDSPEYHEVALNPDDLKGRPTKLVLSTLVHEQVHLWRQEFGTQPQPKTHHDKEWAAKMEDIGLMPSRTGEPGGKKTGRRVTHYVIDKAGFDLSCDELLASGFTLSCVSWPQMKPAKPKVPKATFQCPGCEAKVRGKEEVKVLCGEESCKDDDGQPLVMECMS